MFGAGAASADTLWAVVRYDGSVAAGRSVESVGRFGPGYYEVEFTKKSITSCAYIATLGGSVPFEYSPPGQVSVTLHPGGRAVVVLTRTSDGFLSDRPFHVKVFC
jgi:hypothetical protein